MLGDIERVLEALNSAEVRYLVVGGVAVAWVISLQDLIALKKQARRPQDLEDIEALEALDAGGADEAAE